MECCKTGPRCTRVLRDVYAPLLPLSPLIHLRHRCTSAKLNIAFHASSPEKVNQAPSRTTQRNVLCMLSKALTEGRTQPVLVSEEPRSYACSDAGTHLMAAIQLFWLDKTCIDQNNIRDCLRVLPVNVMACKLELPASGSTRLASIRTTSGIASASFL